MAGLHGVKRNVIYWIFWAYKWLESGFLINKGNSNLNLSDIYKKKNLYQVLQK